MELVIHLIEGAGLILLGCRGGEYGAPENLYSNVSSWGKQERTDTALHMKMGPTETEGIFWKDVTLLQQLEGMITEEIHRKILFIVLQQREHLK